MRYCPNCKRYVGKKYTNAQLMVQILLFVAFLIPGIIYAVCHARKCPICATPTEKRETGGTPKAAEKPAAKVAAKPAAKAKAKKKK